MTGIEPGSGDRAGGSLGDTAGSDTAGTLPATDEALLDARGQRCPMPVINLARHVQEHPEVLRVLVLATDPAAAHDIPAWCRMRGHRFVQARPEGSHDSYLVELLRPTPGAAAP